MASDLKKAGLIFKADGSADFVKSLRNVNATLRENYEDFKLVQAQYDKNTSASQKLTDKLSYLNNAYDLQKNKIRVLQEELEEMTKAEEKDEIAITKKQASLKNAQAQLERYGKQIEEVDKKIRLGTANIEEMTQKIDDVGNKMKEVGKKASVASAAIVAVGTAGIMVGSDFEAAMSEVKAISGATGEDFNKLQEKAKQMGATTKFSATESANAMYYMALAGWKAEDMLDGIEGVMNLAAASGEDLAIVSDIVTDGLTSMGYAADQSAKFADVFAKTVTNSNTDVAGLGEAMKYTGSIAGALNLSIEDISLTLGLMANSGVKASQAGTSLRAILQRLSTNTNGARDVIEDLGIEVFDSEGKMRDFGDVIADMRVKFADLTDEQKTSIAKTVAGTTAMSGFLAIVNSSDEDFNKLTNAVNNSNGAAKEMSDIMINNLKGDFTLIKSQLEGLGIQLTETLLPILRNLLSKISDFLTWLSKLDPKTQAIIILIGGIVAAIGPLLIVLGTMASSVSKIIMLLTNENVVLAANVVKKGAVTLATNAWKIAQIGLNGVLAIGKLAISGVSAALSFLAANPIVLVIAAIAALVAGLVYLWNTNEGFRNAIISTWTSIQNLFIGFNEFLTGIFQTDWTESFGVLGNTNAFFANFSNYYEAIKQVLSGIIDFVKGVFTGDWSLAFEGIRNIFGGIFNSLLAIAKAPLNGIIGLLNILLDGVNFLIRGLNKIKFDVPDWVPGIGGKKLGFNLKQIGKIPYMADGGTLLQGAAVVAEAGPELLIQQGNKTKVVPLKGNSKNTNIDLQNNQDNQRPIFQPNITINSNSKYLSEAETARQTRIELQRMLLKWGR